MNWFYLILICVLFTSIANILRRLLMKNDKSDPISYSVVFHFIVTIFNLLFALYAGFKLPEYSLNLVWFIAAALAWGACSVFVFKALQLIEASEVTLISSLRILITITGAVIFLGESFNIQKIIGSAAILFSVFVVVNLKKGITFNRGIIYTLLMTCFAGLGIVIDTYNVRNYDAVSYNVVVNFLITILLLLFYPKTLKQLKSFIDPGFIQRMLPLGLFTSVQAIAYYMALERGANASQIGPILQSQVIVTVVLAAFLLKEKDHFLRKIIAAIIVSFGVLLVR